MIQQNLNTIDVSKIREQFPVLKRTIHGKTLRFLDSAASSQMPLRVTERMNQYHLNEHSNVHRGVHTLSQEATAAYEATRKKLVSLINANNESEIIFTSGATDALNLVAYSYVVPFLKEGDEILISEMEHHANIVPWQLAAKKVGAIIKVIPISDDGDIDLDTFESLLTERTKLVAITHVSNVLGTVVPVKIITQIAKKYGAIVVVDGCQAAPHITIDVKDLGVDFYTFSSHKIYGPTGIGVLWGRQDLLEKMPPFRGGGDMIDVVTFEQTTFNDLPHKFEAGTPPIVSGIGFGEAIDFVNEIGFEAIHEHESMLLDYATNALKTINGLHIYGNSTNKHAVISFNVDDIHSHDLGTILDQYGVAVRTGHHCAQPLMKRLKVPSTARASFAIYSTTEDVDALVEAIYEAKNLFS